MENRNQNDRFYKGFTEQMYGGAFVFSASEGHELLYANKNMIDLFECEDYDDFIDFTGNSFEGIVNRTSFATVMREIELQISDGGNEFGYVFFNILTKKENSKRVVTHWTLRHDDEIGDVFYATVYFHRLDNPGSEFDSVTGLHGRRRFRSYVKNKNEALLGKNEGDLAIIYLNLVNFKLLNIEKGTAEGDKCLRILSEILSRNFKDSYVSRLSDDHFAIFTAYDSASRKLENARKKFAEYYGTKAGVYGKAGIYRFTPQADFDVEHALSKAKAAGDFIKHDRTRDIVEYSDEITKNLKITDYVINNIDEAMEKGWIKIYYQPVIRTLTGCLCGMESLVRWIDPEMGFLTPDQFIGALEQERCIHKLDSFVVERVCECIYERTAKGLPMVPVSVNFSRMDFAMCDMLEIVERAVEKYDIPRDYIHIEITESMIVSDSLMMKNVIEGFRKAGYEVWMDDFGSGYSSLTMLKEFNFDMLKLDMMFMSPLNEASKSVVSSTVSMAKDIRMKTLAEGVETEEHVSFLKQVGCGMIQGYFYGKPEPIDDVFEHLREKNIPIETRRLRHFYDVAGFNARPTDAPLEIIEHNGENFRTLFMNAAYKKQIFDGEPDLEEVDRRLYHKNSPILHKFHEFAEVVEKSDREETFYYTFDKKYFCLKAKCLAEYNGRYIIKASIFDITSNQFNQKLEGIDSRLHELNHLFEDVIIVNLEKDTIEPLLGSFRYIDAKAAVGITLQKSIVYFVREKIFPSEQERCLDFLRSVTLHERVIKSQKAYISDIFRVKQPDGSYIWEEIFLIIIPHKDGEEYLFCMKPYDVKTFTKEEIESYVINSSSKEGSALGEYANIIENLIWNSRAKFFWKDKEYRYKGASKAFLDYFGFKTSDEIVGKTDGDLNWNINDKDIINEENEVLEKGKITENIYLQRISNGVARNIVLNQMPLRTEGEVTGIIGIIEDMDERTSQMQMMVDSSKSDPVTGLMNARSFVGAMTDYAMEYNEKRRNYGIIVLNNASFSRIILGFGDGFGERLLKEIADRILQEINGGCVVARTMASIFAVIAYVDTKEELEELAGNIKKNLNGIRVVDGNDVTIRMKTVCKLRSEEGVIDESIYAQALKDVL